MGFRESRLVWILSCFVARCQFCWFNISICCWVSVFAKEILHIRHASYTSRQCDLAVCSSSSFRHYISLPPFQISSHIILSVLPYFSIVPVSSSSSSTSSPLSLITPFIPGIILLLLYQWTWLDSWSRFVTVWLRSFVGTEFNQSSHCGTAIFWLFGTAGSLLV